ncbi:MAG: HesA/MoeB/ThiF family protein [Roseibacillus sp.]|nr:MoeZ/MoeB [Deltaproteobacteria bacterium]MCS5540168.1 HesA/MoeB/ThiF family protein [Roseibacillus sp.]NRB27961.1 HesA/MoeB/ThiF family protein [Roseibacillus sp.]
MELTGEERAIYEWQIWVDGLSESGQEKLKGATALITRVGGLGGPLAQSLAAAGIGKLILAHAGNTRLSDLNRQILQTHGQLGKSRIESCRRRLLELNPRLEIEAVPENVTEDNSARLVAGADVVFDCAPLFEERLLLNRECVRQHKPLIDAAIFDLEGQLTTIIPGQTPCLACLYPEIPPGWKREFPVIGAVSATVANLAALEGIKLLAGFGELLTSKLLVYDARSMTFRKIAIHRRVDCAVCSTLAPSPERATPAEKDD